MKIQKGDIYLINFGKKYQSEFGKIRPAVIIQNEFLNNAVNDNIYKTILVVPLTTKLAGGDYRLRIDPRENLKETSECVANWICTLDIDRVIFEKNLITRLSDGEIKIVEKMIYEVIHKD